MKQIIFTKNGFEEVQKEYTTLLDSRPAAVEDLKKAREMGDLSENGYYKGARAKLSQIDARLRHLKYLLRFGKVKEVGSATNIDIGTTVVLESDGKIMEYTIVGEHEANPSEKKISHKSPLGNVLMGKKPHDTVSITTPTGQKSYKIQKIM